MLGFDPYAVLGITRDATALQITGAHRRLAKKAHPDIGGDGKTFAAIQLAYEVLKDPARRKLYDETGKINTEAENGDQPAWGLLMGLLTSVLGAEEDPVHYELVRLMRDQLNKQLAELDNNTPKLERMAARARKLAKRFKRKPRNDTNAEQPNVLALMLEHHARSVAEVQDKEKVRRAQMVRAMELLEEYEFDAEAMVQQIQVFGFTTSTSSTGGF